MEFEWDEDKRLANLIKHGLDFLKAKRVFENLHSIASGKTVNDEPRWLATGYIEQQLCTVVFTRRINVIRIISVRRARNDEKRRYQAVHLN